MHAPRSLVGQCVAGAAGGTWAGGAWTGVFVVFFPGRVACDQNALSIYTAEHSGSARGQHGTIRGSDVTERTASAMRLPTHVGGARSPPHGHQ